MQLADAVQGAVALLRPASPAPKLDFDAIVGDALRENERRRRPAYRFNPSAVSRMCLYKRGVQIDTDRWYDVDAPNETLGRLGLLGSGIHRELQSRVYPRIGSQLFGRWECPTCKAAVLGVMPDEPCLNHVTTSDGRKIECSGMWAYGEYRFEYKALDVEDHHYWITGMLDGIYIRDGSWYVIELKTLAYTLYNELYFRKSTSDDPRVTVEGVANLRSRIPLFSHVEQAHICGTAVHRMVLDGDIPSPGGRYGGAIVLNMSRDNGRIKTSVSLPDHTHMDRLLGMITAVKAAKGDASSLPKKCRTRAQAKGCYLASGCFPSKHRANARTEETE